VARPEVAGPAGRALVFVDESGRYLLPGVAKTSGPKGLLPIIAEWQTHDHRSVMAGSQSPSKQPGSAREKLYFFMQRLVVSPARPIFRTCLWRAPLPGCGPT
jgi:hypothetical protein